jgi:hypothetical protein
VGYQEYVPFAFDLDYLCRGCGEEGEDKHEDTVLLLLTEKGEEELKEVKLSVEEKELGDNASAESLEAAAESTTD